MTREPPSAKEIAREYRVAQQTLSMHADLRDQYARLGLGVEILLLVFTALVSTTTFAGDDFYKTLHIAPDLGRLFLGVASAVAFSGSLVLLLIDPRGRSARHGEIAGKWSALVLEFRRYKLENDTWPEDRARELADAYAETCDMCSPIPERKFNSLKSRYLRKVEVSRLKDRHPGCPIMVLGLLCRLRDTHAAIRAFRRESSEGTAPASSNRDRPAGGGVPDGS
ncbi:MAG: hypothetical protein KJZ69_17680 [Phycisphaerales bacterium]|nr:hypothetical protein [Phycisphaerales bacterium]